MSQQIQTSGWSFECLYHRLCVIIIMRPCEKRDRHRCTWKICEFCHCSAPYRVSRRRKVSVMHGMYFQYWSRRVLVCLQSSMCVVLNSIHVFLHCWNYRIRTRNTTVQFVWVTWESVRLLLWSDPLSWPRTQCLRFSCWSRPYQGHTPVPGKTVVSVFEYLPSSIGCA